VAREEWRRARTRGGVRHRQHPLVVVSLINNIPFDVQAGKDVPCPQYDQRFNSFSQRRLIQYGLSDNGLS